MVVCHRFLSSVLTSEISFTVCAAQDDTWGSRGMCFNVSPAPTASQDMRKHVRPRLSTATPGPARKRFAPASPS